MRPPMLYSLGRVRYGAISSNRSSYGFHLWVYVCEISSLCSGFGFYARAGHLDIAVGLGLRVRVPFLAVWNVSASACIVPWSGIN